MGDFFALRAKKSQHHGRGRACPARGLTESARLRETTPGGYGIRPYGKPLPPLLRFVCRAGCPHPAAGRRGRRPLQWRTANFPAMADVCGGLWAGRPTHSLQKRGVGEGFIPPGMCAATAGASGTPPPTVANRKHISVFSTTTAARRGKLPRRAAVSCV